MRGKKSGLTKAFHTSTTTYKFVPLSYIIDKGGRIYKLLY